MFGGKLENTNLLRVQNVLGPYIFANISASIMEVKRMDNNNKKIKIEINEYLAIAIGLIVLYLMCKL